MQFYKYQLALGGKYFINDFSADNNNSNLFKFKQKITREANKNEIKHVEIRVPLKYLSNYWRTFEMLLTNCEIRLMLTWSKAGFLIEKIKIQNLQ